MRINNRCPKNSIKKMRVSGGHHCPSGLVALVLLPLFFAGCAWQRSRQEMRSFAEQSVALVLNSLHDAASKADEARYFRNFAHNAVFLGTDDTERWTVEQFRAYTHPFFAKGQGWTYTVVERYVYVSYDSSIAWFDERLDNAKWGRCRGSGVLVGDSGEGWKIVQYNLTVPIPNELLPEVAGRIKEFEAERAKGK